MRFVVFADNDRTRGVFVDAMDDSRAHDASDPGQIILAVIHDGVDDRAAVMTGGRMYHHIFGLIDDKKVVILIENGKRNIFRCDVRLCSLRNGKDDLIVRFKAVACLLGSSIDKHLIFFDALLNKRS